MAQRHRASVHRARVRVASDGLSPAVAACPVLWSKGWALHCDVRGPEDYWRAPTESLRPATFFARHYSEARGLVWVRLGTAARDGVACDLDCFVREALPTIREPFALITTDGDATVPSDLDPATVGQLLASPWLVSWHTQNHDGAGGPKLAPLPIGLDLHTVHDGRGPVGTVAVLAAARKARRHAGKAALRVFCDLNASTSHEERRRAVVALRDCRHVHILRRRVPQARIWRRYTRYPFVLSTMGNGLDTHRTWELLYLGCIVITKTSPLDPLYEGLPVAIVGDWEEVRDKANLARWREELAPLTARDHIWNRLTPDHDLNPIRAAVSDATAGDHPPPVVSGD